MAEDILTWDLEAMNNCRKKINACCGLLMQGSSAIASINVPSGYEYYKATLETISKSVMTAGKTLYKIKNALLRNELELEKAEKESEQLIDDMFDKFFFQGLSLEEMGFVEFREDITYKTGYEEKSEDCMAYTYAEPVSENYIGETNTIIIWLHGGNKYSSLDNYSTQDTGL